MAVIKPSGTLSVKEPPSLKYEGNINNPRIPHTNGILNAKDASLYITFLIGGHFDSTDPCGYHLQVNDPNCLPGMSNDKYKPFHDFLE